MTDHNEAMRLADALAQPGVRYATETEAQAKLRRIKTQAEAAALIRKQAERIAELEADYQRLMDKHNALHVNALKDRTERDTLRAEMEKAHAAGRDQGLREAKGVCEGMHEEDRPGDYVAAIEQLEVK